MVAPGDSLEFSEGPSFKRSEGRTLGLGDAIRTFYTEHPHNLILVDAMIRKGSIQFQGKAFEFLIVRKGPTKVYLLAVVEIVGGRGFTQADLDHFKGIFRS